MMMKGNDSKLSVGIYFAIKMTTHRHLWGIIFALIGLRWEVLDRVVDCWSSMFKLSFHKSFLFLSIHKWTYRSYIAQSLYLQKPLYICVWKLNPNSKVLALDFLPDKSLKYFSSFHGRIWINTVDTLQRWFVKHGDEPLSPLYYIQCIASIIETWIPNLPRW